uniref:Secreted protein n=1 Tax=Panagrellus redivivus TaxID=6233 RepID=A0A7E4VSP7_PANRE
MKLYMTALHNLSHLGPLLAFAQQESFGGGQAQSRSRGRDRRCTAWPRCDLSGCLHSTHALSSDTAAGGWVHLLSLCLHT